MNMPLSQDLSVMDLLTCPERIQLGAYGLSGSEWRSFRRRICERDLRRRPSTNPRLMAYTPGETLELFYEAEVASWHSEMAQYRVPDDVNLICFVPCAATKPWEGATRGLYKSYNLLRQERDRGEIPNFYFVTISEPLGLVPEEKWGSFPQYENPGLFPNNYLRFGMTNREIEAHFGRRVEFPFDNFAYETAIETLGSVISRFAAKNEKKGRRFISFVDGTSEKTTHSDMLDCANSERRFIPSQYRFPKREAPRKEPYGLIRRIIQSMNSV